MSDSSPRPTLAEAESVERASRPERERIFEACWDCDRVFTASDDEWPLCDDCVIGRGPANRWCCKDEDGTTPPNAMPYRVSMCQWNVAFWNRHDDVWARRALTGGIG